MGGYWELVASWNWDAIVGWGFAITAVACLVIGSIVFLIHELVTAPTIEDEEPIVYGPRAVAVRKEMRADLIAYHGLQDEVSS